MDYRRSCQPFIEAGLAIGRQNRRFPYRLDAPPKAVPQVPEERRFEVRERIDHTGRVLTGLTDEAVGEVVRKVADSGAGAPFRVTIETAPGEAYELPGKATVRLGRDDKVIVESCGGGYGTPTPQQEEEAG